MKSVSIEYLAGYFDANACIRGTLQSSGTLTIAITIAQKNPLPLHQFKEYFGVGAVGLYPQMPPYRHYTFYAYSNNVQVILEGLLPYLIVKREEAELALQALSVERDRWGGFSIEAQDMFQFIERRLRQLKRIPVEVVNEVFPQDGKILTS